MTTTLRAAVGTYPHTRALKEGRVPSGLVALEFAEVSPISKAFAPMVREAAFDVSEMAIATFLQAQACGKPIVLLPVVLAQRFQERALLCRADSAIAGPGDLRGKRVGVRAYSQTTCMWLRGVLADGFGVAAGDMRWVTFEGAHVAEIADPPWAERAAPGQELMAMLAAGELDAVIVGNDVPDDPGLRTVFPDPKEAAGKFWKDYGVVPPNHLLTVRRELADSRPELVLELMRMFAWAGEELGEGLPFGLDDVRPGVDLALRFTAAQDMLPRALTPDEVWDDLPEAARSLKVERDGWPNSWPMVG